MLHPDELDSRTARQLITIADDAKHGYDAAQVRARAAGLVGEHARRLGLGAIAAASLVGMIEAIPVRANG